MTARDVALTLLAGLLFTACGPASTPSDAATGPDASASNDAAHEPSADAGPSGGTDASDPRTDGGAGPGGGAIAQIAAGRYHTCARMRDGSVYCWGQGAYRQLGGDYGYQGTATRVEAFSDAVALDCGGRFTCAVRAGGAVWCWGDNSHGQVGGNATVPCGDSSIDSVCVTTPQPIAGLASDVVELALGNEHACARRGDGSVWCWGNNANGQVGDADLSDHPAPRQVPGVAGAVQVVAGDAHTCALVGAPGRVLCWGNDANAQVGDGTTGDAVSAPAEVAGLTDAVEVVGGGEHTCARRASGAVVCWGYDYLGQLGNGSTRPTRATSLQAVVSLDDAVQLAAGRYHTCARRAGGTIACWGDNDKGEVGSSDTSNQTSPQSVDGVSGATLVTGGWWCSCAVLAAGGMVCWGDDLGGELGDNRVSSDPTTSPVAVMGLPML